MQLEDLAAELNGMGGKAGIAELRDPIWKVKNGEVNLVDLDTPAENVDFERDLAQKTGIDALIFDLFYNNMSLKAAADHLPQAKFSDLERKVLGEMSPEDLLEVGRTLVCGEPKIPLKVRLFQDVRWDWCQPRCFFQEVKHHERRIQREDSNKEMKKCSDTCPVSN